MDINNIKYPRVSPEPAKCLLLLVSSALLFVYLAAQLRGGHTTGESLIWRDALWETESLGAFMKTCTKLIILTVKPALYCVLTSKTYSVATL